MRAEKESSTFYMMDLPQWHHRDECCQDLNDTSVGWEKCWFTGKFLLQNIFYIRISLVVENELLQTYNGSSNPCMNLLNVAFTFSSWSHFVISLQISIVTVIFFSYMSSYYLSYYVFAISSKWSIVFHSFFYSTTHMINPVRDPTFAIIQKNFSDYEVAHTSGTFLNSLDNFSKFEIWL